MLYVAEITAAIDDAGALQTFLFGTREWCTLPTDTPANTQVRNRLLNPGGFARDMGSGRTLFGAVRVTRGELVLNNADGALDVFARYGLDWQLVVLRCCEPVDGAIPAYPGGWTTALVATVDAVQSGFVSLTLRLRDRLDLLDRPVCARYAGTGGIEGPAQLAGQPKPRVYGSLCNAVPVCVDAPNNIWHISDKPYTQVRWAWDMRSALVPMSSSYNDAGSFAALQSVSVPSGQYARCSDLGLVKVGAVPAGAFTVDPIRHDAAYSASFGRSRLGELLSDIAADAGLVSGVDFDAGIASLSVPGNSLGAFACDLDTTAMDVLVEVAASGCAWVGNNRLGILTAGVVAAPSGTPVWTFTRDNCCADDPINLAVGGFPVPISNALVRGGRNWSTMQASEISSGVSRADAQLLAQQYTYSESASGGATPKHASAAAQAFDTCAGPAGTSAPTTLPGAGIGFSPSQALALFGVERDYVVVRAPITIALLTAVDLGSIVAVRWSRFGFDAGKLFMCIGVQCDFDGNVATCTLWG